MPDPTLPGTTEPETLEEWRDQALFQAQLVAQLNRDCMRLRNALAAIATGRDAAGLKVDFPQEIAREALAHD